MNKLDPVALLVTQREVLDSLMGSEGVPFRWVRSHAIYSTTKRLPCYVYATDQPMQIWYYKQGFFWRFKGRIGHNQFPGLVLFMVKPKDVGDKLPNLKTFYKLCEQAHKVR